MGTWEAADLKTPHQGESVGGIKNRLRAGQSEVQDTAQARDYSLFKNVRTSPGVHPVPHAPRTGVPSPEAKDRAWNFPLSNLREVKGEWKPTSIPPVRL